MLYLVRHADAADAEIDSIRELSPRGRGQLKHLAALLRRGAAFTPDAIWHSPLVRARQTAEALLVELPRKVTWQERRDLEPESDPKLIASALAEERQSIALFGHEPHMSSLATLLVTGEVAPVGFTFRKATMLALEPAGRRWCVRWQLSPDLFPD